MQHSLAKAAAEQDISGLSDQLTRIVPDIGDQYTTFKVDHPYVIQKVRMQHAFQMFLVDQIMDQFEQPTVVDIGDSAGTHLKYLLGLYPDKNGQFLSVNLDASAVEKIKSKGLDAVHARAEEIEKYNINADIFICFEMLEHLMNPADFLYKISTRTHAQYLIITVPYVKRSRVGLHHIRHCQPAKVSAENTHIFELNPEDWKLIARHAGWKIYRDHIYRQYPKRSLMRLTRKLWKRFDFEGFYGMILKPDQKWSSMYSDWH